jgi:hypothetical protein
LIVGLDFFKPYFNKSNSPIFFNKIELAKNNASYMAINDALYAVQQQGDLQVPLPIRNAPTQLIKKLNYCKDY